MTLILGSQSPRRAEILRFFSVPFVQAPSFFDESQLTFTGNPIDYTTKLAQGKAQELRNRYPADSILTADTTVYCEGIVYNKPNSLEEAIDFLTQLSGKWHSVFTSLVLHTPEGEKIKCAETKILFHPLTSAQIRSYLSNIHFLDKAGGYAIQQGGGLIVQEMQGCYYNVMGLPLTPLQELFHSINIDLWKQIRCT